MTVFLSFDVEAVGLYGEVFSVGWVIGDEIAEYSSGYLACDHSIASGSDENRKWISENVIPVLPESNCANPTEVKNKFWNIYMDAKAKYPGLMVISDCGSPLEAKFLSDCVMLDLPNRQWEAPYPLHELATMLLAVGDDPIGVYPRNESELPKHHPTNDARQSLRLFLSAYSRAKKSINIIYNMELADGILGEISIQMNIKIMIQLVRIYLLIIYSNVCFLLIVIVIVFFRILFLSLHQYA